MTLTITEVVKQFKQDWTTQLELAAILATQKKGVGVKFPPFSLGEGVQFLPPSPPVATFLHAR